MNEGLSLEEYKKRLSWYDKKYGPYIEKRGLHNFKNLFRMPNLYELVIFFMLLLSLFITWAYNEDTKTAREMVNNFEILCLNYKNSILQEQSTLDDSLLNNSGLPSINLSNPILRVEP